MKYVNAIYKENKYSFWFLSLVWILAFYFLVTKEKEFLVLYFNENRRLTLDQLFSWLTKFGEGEFCVLVCIVVTIFNWKNGLFISLAVAINSLIAQFLKKIVFPSSNRPFHYFPDVLKPIAGQEYHSSFSFPSGHTMAAMSVFFCVSLLTKNKPLKILSLCIGLLTAISRVYLGQHFLEDITVASLLAVALTYMYYAIYLKNINIQ